MSGMIKRLPNTIRQKIAYFISILPGNFIRVFLYRILFHYKIENSEIGRGTLINVHYATLSNCKIGKNNRFEGPMVVTIETGTKIGSHNLFQCGWWTTREEYKQSGYKRSLHLAKQSLITSNHYFDLAGSFTLGDHSWIAGNDSQFWTHGAGVTDRDISIGRNCYIGSAVRFTTGVTIADNTLVAIGSIVTKKFVDRHVLIAGNPAKIVKESYVWKK